MTDGNGIRLNKFISDSGFCSRREADRAIAEGTVSIDGKTAETGIRVFPGSEVRIEGRRIRASASNKSDRVYIAYNKPIGITCTTESGVQGNIVDAIGHRQRIFPIGRLDKPSEGLIFLTSDGDIVNKILRAENAHDKEYLVTVNRPLTKVFEQRMSQGIPILGTVTQPCKVTIQSQFVFKIILTQGLNRQIRRMCEYLGYEVTKLKRNRIMNVSLGKLKPGEWRNLTPKEMGELNGAVAGSTATAENTGGSTKRPKHSARRKTSQPSVNRAAQSRFGGKGEGRSKANSTSTKKPKISTNRTAKLRAAKKKANKKQANKR